MWPHTYNIEHDEYCEVCGEKLELRMVGKDEWVYYCRNCLHHQITPAREVGCTEDRT